MAESSYDEAVVAGDSVGVSDDRLVIVGSVGEGSESLQERFLRFKKERQRERALCRKSANRASAPTVRDIAGLRKRFVDACYSYIGVPYGRKGHEPDEPEYDAPLFLDCCGLVRRVVKDLQEDFGFSIGRWNQAYQFETLPKVLGEEELRPGDLVFVEGKYFDEKRRPQRHDIVHVEVFVGGDTGRATIGSRWAKSNPAEGKVRGVQLHPSYSFESKNYDIKAYHFRSLDTWLHGSCRSQTFPDAVAPAPANTCGKSIFEHSDEAASDDDDDGSKEAELFVPNPYRDAPVFYVGEGNNWQVIAKTMETLGWRRLPFDAHYSNRFDLKWVEQRSKIDYRRHLEGQLVNHIPNNDVITSKTKFLDTIRVHEVACGESFRWHPESFCSDRCAEKLAALASAEANPSATWILKPARGNGGTGIEIIRGPERLRERLFPAARDIAQEPSRVAFARDGLVVQRYLERPLLLDGRKFDVRVYCLVARTTPHLWFFNSGYCRTSLERYDPDNLDNRLANLTNACVQKTHPDYRTSLRGSHIWSLAQVEEHLVATARWPTDAGQFWPRIHDEMKKAMVWIFDAARATLERRAGYFDLLGLDFILDEGFGVHLLEVNSNPALWFDSSPTLQTLIPDLIESALAAVLAAQNPKVESFRSPPAFDLIIDEASGFAFGRQ